MESRITTPVISEFEIVKQMLTAHIDLLRQHLIYLMKVKNGKVLEDDIYEYLKDLLGFRVPDNGKFKADYLPIMLQSLKNKMAIFLKLSEIAKHDNQEVAISALYLALESELAIAKHQEKVTKSIATIESKMQNILSNADSISSLMSSLKPLLPESHAKLAEIIYVKPKSTKEYAKKEDKTHFTFSAGFVFDWNKAFFNLQKIANRSTVEIAPSKQKNKDDHFKETVDWIEENRKEANQEKQTILDNLQAFMELVPKFESRRQANSRFQAVSDTAHFDLLVENVLFYYEINPIMKNTEKFFTEGEKILEIHKQLEKNYNIARRNILAKTRSFNRMADLLTQSIKNIFQKQKWQAHKETFDRLLKEIENIKEDITIQLTAWPEKKPAEWTDELIDQKLNEFKALSKEFKKRLASIETEYFSIREQVEAVKQEVPEPQSSPYIPPPAVSTARDLYLKEREKIDREYKQTVEQRRQEKAQAEKMQELKKKDEKPVGPIVVYKNLDVEQRLLGMSDQNFQFLLNLFNFEKGIKYSSVCNLIKNQLDGEIEEIGCGSSHKRIRIAKYFVEVISRADEQDMPSTDNVAVGGFFRPHGSAHQPGVMSRFNMELVVSTFIKAGITIDILNQIKQKRALSEGTSPERAMVLK